MRLLPAWLRGYERAWLARDLVAGLVVWGVVVPQATAYAQIAGLPPAAGLVAAPGALLGYALVGTSRSLIVGATTSTAGLSAATVGALAHGDAARFAALSAAFALVAAVVLALGGLLRLGAITDFISKPIMVGFLFGLGLSIAMGQLPKLLGVPAGDGGFFGKLADLIKDLGDTQAATLAVGLASIAALVALRRLAPNAPGSLIVLLGAIAISAILGLEHHGVAVVGKLPDALPDPQVPDVSWGDVAALVGPAFGMIALSAEGLGVGRSLAAEDRYRVDASRELVGFGAANLLAGASGGFVADGGASQTAAARRAGGRTQLASIVAAGLVLLTGAFLAPVFEPLPQATLAAIVIVAVAGFFDVASLRRFGRIRSSALALALCALGGVLVLGVLRGLLAAMAIAFAILVRHLSRPGLGALGRDPVTGAWARADRHPDLVRPADTLVIRVDSLLFYANAQVVQDHVLALAREPDEPPRAVVLELAQSDIDIETLDMLADLATTLDEAGSELRLAAVRGPVRDLLERAEVVPRVPIDPTLDAAAGPDRLTPTG